MKRSLVGPATLAIALAVLTGCAGPTPKTTAGSPNSSPSPSVMASGQAMAGMVMPGSAATKTLAKPTDTQALVCGDEIKDTVKQVLQLAKRPPTQTSFMAGLYTCSYALPIGPMRLSVQHSASAATAAAYLHARSKATGAGIALAGLGEQAYGTGDGVVFVIKDNEVLEVDTTALPKVFGNEQQKRSDLAYEIASDVLGCWTGDDS